LKEEKSNGRKIHVSLTEDVHQLLRVKCAIKNLTLQEYVSVLIEDDVRDVRLSKEPNGVKRVSYEG